MGPLACLCDTDRCVFLPRLSIFVIFLNNSLEIELTCHKIHPSLVHNSLVFSYSDLCSCPQCLVPDINQWLSILLPPVLATINLCVSTDSPVLDLSWKGNHTTHVHLSGFLHSAPCFPGSLCSSMCLCFISIYDPIIFYC